MQVSSHLSHEISEQFQHSYGGWSVMALFLEDLEFLHLQGLNRRAYRTLVSRVQ